MNAANSLVNGDYKGVAINGSAIILGNRLSRTISNSSLNPLSKSILDGKINLKINGLLRLIDK